MVVVRWAMSQMSPESVTGVTLVTLLNFGVSVTAAAHGWRAFGQPASLIDTSVVSHFRELLEAACLLMFSGLFYYLSHFLFKN
jgi:hypothetical protein